MVLTLEHLCSDCPSPTPAAGEQPGEDQGGRLCQWLVQSWGPKEVEAVGRGQAQGMGMRFC